MAEEFPESALSPSFRSNGTSDPGTDAYVALAQGQFATYKLVVDGLVENPLALTLADIHALPSREQITRHDCVEGWSAIARWKGARLSAILAAAKPKANARYIVFHCADPMNDDGTGFYYESIDFEDAYHEQTILAYDLNRAPLPIANGAPLRLRVERAARLQAREVFAAPGARRELCAHRRRQRRLLGRQRVPVVRGHLRPARRAR